MIIRLLSIGTRPSTWLKQGFDEYARRLTRGLTLELNEIPLAKGKLSSAESLSREGAKILAAIPPGALVVALDRHGSGWDTQQLAEKLNRWQQNAATVCLLIGGPEGLSEKCKQRADECWSLSPLTFPHMLVRVMVAEQIYRARSYNVGHPYHRQ